MIYGYAKPVATDIHGCIVPVDAMTRKSISEADSSLSSVWLRQQKYSTVTPHGRK